MFIFGMKYFLVVIVVSLTIVLGVAAGSMEFEFKEDVKGEPLGLDFVMSTQFPECASVEALEALQTLEGHVEIFDLSKPMELPANVNDMLEDYWSDEITHVPEYDEDRRTCAALAATSAGVVPITYRFWKMTGVSGEERQFVEMEEISKGLFKRLSTKIMDHIENRQSENSSILDSEKYKKSKEIARNIFQRMYENGGVGGVKEAVRECYLSSEKDSNNPNMHAHCIYMDSFSCSVINVVAAQAGFPPESYCSEKELLTRIDSSFAAQRLDQETIGNIINDAIADAQR